MSKLLKLNICRVPVALFSIVALIVMSKVEIAGSQTLDQKFEEYLKGAQRVHDFTGTALVAKDGKVLFTKGYGMADIATSRPNTPETKYLIGSITKQFTATAIMQLSEKKLLDLDHPIINYLPDYPKPAAQKVTIYHLLTHTSGIANLTDLPELEKMYTKPAKHEDVVSLFKDIPLQIEPGSEWRYSNSNYYLLGLIIERVSGETYGEYLQKHICDPLGMSNSGFPPGIMDVPGLATGYTIDSTNNYVPAQVLNSSWPFSGGGLYTTVGDMVKWDQGLRSGIVLSKKSLSQMFIPFKTDFGFGYGFGWEIDTLFGHHMVSHGGLINGFCSIFLRFVDQPFCVVVLSNMDVGNVKRIAIDLAAIAFGQPYDVPVTKTPVAVDPTILDDYVGAYEMGPETYSLVTREGDTLYSQKTGGARIRLHAEAKDKFFSDRDHPVTLTFIRDVSGKVSEHIIHQHGRDLRACRIEGEKAQKLLESLIPATIDPATYQVYAGDYEVAPGLVITFRCRDNRFFTQATGQDEVEVFPRSETEFFLKVVDGSVSFVKDSTGTVTGLIIHQGGRDLPAKKIR
jgi:CubicO group peptidase (beta-lactamase class C family)